MANVCFLPPEHQFGLVSSDGIDCLLVLRSLSRNPFGFFGALQKIAAFYEMPMVSFGITPLQGDAASLCTREWRIVLDPQNRRFQLEHTIVREFTVAFQIWTVARWMARFSTEIETSATLNIPETVVTSALIRHRLGRSEAQAAIGWHHSMMDANNCLISMADVSPHLADVYWVEQEYRRLIEPLFVWC
jgi:hypothetical protein